MFKKYLSWASAAVLAGATLLAPPAIAQETCVAGECTVEFSYEGTAVSWSTPQGASNLRFEVYGAAGGRGGLGGSVTGTFEVIPESLFIVVGGVGGVGSGAAGGYNGGGNAGGNRGNEGSGGGASDIRLGTSLESRIVVAGGGGGAGGYSGAAGAPGGGLNADNGGSGQGSGGGGGSQVAGGFNGASNGGSASSAGSFGQGGFGGSSWNAGGGGGGGGWYGGGGGGADDDDCCSDGGGGGGGSSYVDPNYISISSHTKGVQVGHGKIVLRYTLLPSVRTFSGVQSDASTAEFIIEFTLTADGLGEEDFAITPEACLLSSITVEQLVASVILSDCSDGEITLTLLANAVGVDVTGPIADQTATVDFDATGPEVNWLTEPFATSLSEVVLVIDLGDNQAAISSESFTTSGCEALEYQAGIVTLATCSEGVVVVTLLANALSDSWGNQSPMQDLSFEFVIDQTGPTPIESVIDITGDGPYTYSLLVSFSETVSFTMASVTFTSSADCATTSSQVVGGWLFEANCGWGEGVWTIPENSVEDSLGNFGPLISRSFAFSNLEPVIIAPLPVFTPVVAEDPDPTPAPPPVVEPAPIAVTESPETESATTESQEIAQDVVTESKTISAVIVEQIAKAIAIPRPTLTATPEPTPTQSVEVEELELEPTELDQVLVTETSEPVVAKPVAGPPLASEPDPSVPWLPIALAAVVCVLGFGIWRFSGR